MIRGVAAMVELNGVEGIVVFADTPESLLEAIGKETDQRMVHCVMMPGPRLVIPPPAPSGPTPEGFAAEFNGRTRGNEIHPAEALALKAADMVAVFGYSDDCTEVRGAIYDEVGLGELRITLKGKLLSDEQNEALKSLVTDGLATDARVGIIKAEFGEQGHFYETAIPHATFDIMEDGELFCRGIVFRLADIGKGVAK